MAEQEDVLTSPALAAIGVPHGFTLKVAGTFAVAPTKEGGTFEKEGGTFEKEGGTFEKEPGTPVGGTFEKAPVGTPVGTAGTGRAPRAEVEAALARLARAAGVEAVYRASQVHGTRVLDVPPDVAPEALAAEEADALVSTRPGRAVAVRTADCVPLLLADASGRVAAAVHAGWRGTAAGIAAAVVAHLERVHGVSAERLRAAIGPSIRVESFEVGEEVAAAFPDWAVRRDLGPRPHVDLVEANRRALRAAGVPVVDVVGGDTFAEPGRYFSYRRDGPAAGRHLSFVAPASRI